MKAPEDAIVYFNGRFMPKNDVRISPDDRGFLLGDGVYEVIRIYDGRLFEAEAHFRRLGRSLRALRLEGPAPADFAGIAQRLMDENDIRDGGLYIHITRGAAPRRHAFPDPGVSPTVYATLTQPRIAPEKWTDGVEVILVPDMRWARCDIKSIALLPNVIANQRAKEAGVEEAVFVRDGALTEGSHTNVCAVIDGTVLTYPSGPYILPGVTRDVVLDLCRELDIPVAETPVFEDELARVEELMILGTTTEVMPVVRVDGRPVGGGTPGPITRRLQQAFQARTRAGG